MNDTVTHSLKFNYSPKEIRKIGLKYINELKDIPQKLKNIDDPTSKGISKMILTTGKYQSI